MLITPDNLIDKFAEMLEKDHSLNDKAFADLTLEIIAMLSIDPSLGETMLAINQKIYSILKCSNEIKHESITTAVSSKQLAAQQLRALKAERNSTRSLMVH